MKIIISSWAQNSRHEFSQQLSKIIFCAKFTKKIFRRFYLALLIHWILWITVRSNFNLCRVYSGNLQKHCSFMFWNIFIGFSYLISSFKLKGSLIKLSLATGKLSSATTWWSEYDELINSEKYTQKSYWRVIHFQ